MTSAKTYDYLTGVLSESIEADFSKKSDYKKDKCTFKGYGEYDKLISRRKLATLCYYFERHLCKSDKKVLLVGLDKKIYVFNGSYFEETDNTGFIIELIKRTMERLGIGLQYLMLAPKEIATEVMRTLVNSEEYLYKPQRRYIAFRNGIFDLREGKIKKFDIRYRPYIVMDIDYLDEKTLNIQCLPAAKLWDEKIKEIIPNKDMRDAFQMFCGSLLFDREEVKVEYVCYLVGPGSNGKSVVASVIAGVFGEQYFSRFSPRQLFKDSDARVNIAALEGKIANLVGDLEQKDISGGDFKRFVSGEKFQGRRNYKDPILVPAPPLLCCANELPESSDDSYGHHRRQLPIFTTKRQWTEEDKDPYLTQKLTTPEARQRVFLWIYEGYRKIIRNGGNVVLGQEVIDAQRVLQEDSNSPRRWLRDSIWCKPKKKDGEWKPLKELFAEYVAYCDENVDEPKKAREVAAMLRFRGYEERRMPKGIEFCLGRKIDND